MESFGAMPMPTYNQSPSSYQILTTGEYIRGTPSYSYPDHPYSNAAYPSTEIPPYSDTLSRSRTYPSYDEPYPESAGPGPDPISPQIPEIERGNKLLCFGNPSSGLAVLDYAMRQTSISLSAQLHGMFFLAKSSRASAESAAVASAELTCYRRNLFQITGQVTLPHMIQFVVTEQGDRVPIISQELTVSAVESVEGSPVKIISVPFKPSAAGAVPAPEDKNEKEPTPFALDQIPNGEVDGEYSILPFAWKRLQFRVATANNGRRKELQQHFTIRLNIMAHLSTGAKVSICQVLSGPIIVRGRSPRNFQAKEDVPLADSRPPGRKSVPSPAVSRHSPADLPPSNPSGHHSSHSHSTPTSQGYFEWPPTSNGNGSLHPGSATGSPSTQRSISVSPYIQHLPELTRNKPNLKRKWTYPQSQMPMKLSIPKESHSPSLGETRSAPPDERPAKLHCHSSRASSTSSPNPPYYSAHPSTTSHYSMPSYSAPAVPSAGAYKAGIGGEDLLYNFYPGSIGYDGWGVSQGELYAMGAHGRYGPPAVTSVGVEGGRGARYLSEEFGR